MPLFWLSISFLTGILLAALAGLACPGRVGFALCHLLPKTNDLCYALLGAKPELNDRFLAFLGYTRCGMPSKRELAPGNTGWLVVALCLGGARYQGALPQIGPTDLAYYNDAPESLVLDGWLLEPADLRDQYSLLRLRVDRLRLPEQGQVLVVDGHLLVALRRVCHGRTATGCA